MTYRLDGPERRELRELLQQAFNRANLVRALAESEPSRDFEQLVSQGPFSDQVFELIDEAERKGWLDQFEKLLAAEVPDRVDLINRVHAIVERARERGMTDVPPPTEKPTKDDGLSRRASYALLLALGGAVCGLTGWTLSHEAGFWGAVGGAVAIAVGALIASAALLRTGRKWLRPLLGRATIAGLMAIFAADGWVLFLCIQDSRQPNFVVQVIATKETGKPAVPLVQRTVFVGRAVLPGADDGRVERITDSNGEAYFRLALGSNRVYIGGVEVGTRDARRTCQFPAFSVERPEMRRVTHDVGGCVEQAATARDPQQSLRVAQPPTVVPTSGEWQQNLPVNLAARRARAPLGLPAAPITLDRIYYTLGYDPKFRTPRWVSFTVDTRRTIRLQRRPDAFQRDPDIPRELQSDPADYQGNPYDRGHLVRRTDALWGDNGEEQARAAEKEINYYSATVPQPDKTNQITWLAVEDFTTRKSADLGPIHVVAGPIYPEAMDKNMPFPVIGPGRTPVPTALFRVLLRQAPGGNWRALAFLVPNDGSSERNVKVFVKSVAEVEAASRLTFFPDLNRDQAAQLKRSADFDRFSANGN